MRPERLFLLVALPLHLLLGEVGASPLPAADTTASSAVPAPSPPTLEQLLRPDPQGESDRGSLQLGAPPAETLPAAAESGEIWNEHRIGAPIALPSLGEQLRGYVNVERARRNPNSPPRRRAAPPLFAGIDLAEAADAWARDTVHALMQSAITLEVDERGRAYFSVLGFGDFSLTLSGDRSRLVLAEGGHALFLAAHPGTDGVAHPDLDPDSELVIGFAQGATSTSYGEHPLRQALERLAEIASHPLSLLMYCVLAAYVVLWSILSHSKSTPQTSSLGLTPPRVVGVPASGSRRRSRRSAGKTSAHTGSRRHSTVDSSSSSRGSRSRAIESGSVTSRRRSGMGDSDASTSRRRKRVRIRIRMRSRRGYGTGTS